MQSIVSEIEHILPILAATPTRMTVLTSSLTPEQLHTNTVPDMWSARTILAHLRACADLWGKSIVAMIAQDTPTLRYISPRTWIRKTNYLEQDFQLSLQAFTKQRKELLAVLEPLTHAGWLRMAFFTGTVRGREQTVLLYAKRLADHETQHLEQLESMARQLVEQRNAV